MSITLLRHEFHEEMGKTRKILASLPDDKLGWKPHDKSSTLGKLAMHIANNPIWASTILGGEEYDFNHRLPAPPAPDSVQVILDHFDRKVAEATAALEAADDKALESIWTCKQGEVVYFKVPKSSGIRNFSISHLIHHRGQLSVYLRLLDIPVHGMYGPSADGI